MPTRLDDDAPLIVIEGDEDSRDECAMSVEYEADDREGIASALIIAEEEEEEEEEEEDDDAEDGDDNIDAVDIELRPANVFPTP